ncbi:MAG: zf-HC2 domain-containing protein [Armatimonadota bacterium]
MNCRQARILIPLEADKQLKGDHHIELQAHLAECDACSEELSSYRASIEGLENALHTISDGITASDGFTSAVAAEAEAINVRNRAKYWLVYRFPVRIIDSFKRSKLLTAAASIAIILAVALVIGNTAINILDTTPVASTKVDPGRLIVFTVHPTTDGSIVAGVHSHGYCQITKSTGEALR